MATITRKKLAQQMQYGGKPEGNAAVLLFNIATIASGVWTGGDATAAPAIGDVLVIGTLPAGMLLQDSLAIVSTAFTALATAKVGFAYCDGVDSSAVPQDDDYFTASLALNAAGRYAANNNAVAPVTLPKNANLILTWAGANNAKAANADILVYGVLTGAP